MYEELVKRLREESEIERWLQPHSANETPKLLDDAANAIEELSKERKTGKWISYIEDGYLECPFCGAATNCDGDESELHFCFSCGAKMEVPTDV